MKRLLLLFAAISLFGATLWADFQIPEKPEGYVVDRAGLLSASTARNLETQLRNFEFQTSNQVVVAIFPSLDGGSLEDISIRMAQQWKIGQKGRDNGVLFLVFRDDRQMRIEVGYGLEGALTDALAAQIIRNEVTPYFRIGNYQAGILSGVKSIFLATKGEYQALPYNADGNDKAWRIIFLIIGIIFALDILRYAFYFGGHRADAGRYGFWEWFSLFAILWLVLRVLLTNSGRGSSWSSGGSGGYSGGGGGFSGGGGSFGGGGASGRW